MITITPDIIKQIAEELDCGFDAFIHKTTGQLITVPNEFELPDIELDGWSEELDMLYENPFDYHKIEKWASYEAFEVMADFAESLTENKKLQAQLFGALNRKKPFSGFKFVIDNSGEFRQNWFDFKNKRQQEFVEQQLKLFLQHDE